MEGHWALEAMRSGYPSRPYAFIEFGKHTCLIDEEGMAEASVPVTLSWSPEFKIHAVNINSQCQLERANVRAGWRC